MQRLSYMRFLAAAYRGKPRLSVPTYRGKLWHNMYDLYYCIARAEPGPWGARTATGCG